MHLTLVTEQELPLLLKIAKETFIHTYQHLNNADDFQAYLNEYFTLEKLQNEINIEGSVYYFLDFGFLVCSYTK